MHRSNPGPILIGGAIYRGSVYGSRHPLSIPRVSSAIDLIEALGWLDPARYRDAPLATPEQLARFHDPAYIDAVRRAEESQRVPEVEQRRHQLGCNGNPLFPEMYRRPATACGASLMAADMLVAGEADLVHSPAGGTHHGRPDRASGFCYFNDPVLGILRMLDQGVGRVAYVDLDAHHGDGVQDAFAEDARVLTISVHEDGRWPFTGPVEDRAGGMARNLPMPQGFNDSELRYVTAQALVPLVERFAPEILVVQCGCDALADDPMSKLELSNRGYWDAIAMLLPLVPRRLLLGGGGYNPWAVARAWAGVWALANGHELPARLPGPAELHLRGLSWNRSQGRNPPEHWFTTLADPPRNGPGDEEVRDAVIRVVEQVLVGRIGAD